MTIRLPITRRRNSRASRWAWVAALCATAWLGSWATRDAAGAERRRTLWEYTPYRVQILVAVDDDPAKTGELAAELGRDVQQRIEASVGSPWDVETSPAPAAVAFAVRWRFDAITAEDLPRKSLDFDKVLIIRVGRQGSGYRVWARDFDVRARVLGAPVAHDVAQRGLLGPAAADALLEAFAPLAEIEQVKDKHSELRLRGAALPTRDPELTTLTQGTVFMPVMRFNNSDGSLKSARVLPWTFLAVEPPAAPASNTASAAKEPTTLTVPAPADRGAVRCRIYSGLRNPLSARRRGRTEQLAVAVSPRPGTTRLELVSATEPDYPLAGYEVHAQPPGSAATTLLGLSDNRGSIEIPPSDEHPLRVLLVKNGGEPVARLPVLPGWEPSLKALVNNDEQRLRVEGFIIGLQERVVDTVARRELLLARSRARLRSGQVQEADKFLQQAKALPTLNQFQQELQVFERTVQTNDPRLKRKIDKLLADTRQVLDKHLAEGPLNELAAEIKTASGTASTPPAGRPSGT